MELPNLGNPKLKTKAKKGGLFKGLLFWAFTGLLFYHGGAWLFRAIAWHALEIEKATSGVLEKTIPLQVVVIREETSLAAPVDGTLTRVVQEGERVAAGGTIAQLKAAGVAVGDSGVRDIAASFAGQVCYHPDGLEKVLQPAFIEQIDPKEVFPLAQRARTVEGGEIVKAGVPVIRLVNNLHPLFLYARVEEIPANWQEKKQVILRWPGQEDKITARIVRSYPLDGQLVMVLKLDKWSSQWLHTRLASMEAIGDRYEGMVLPRAALVALEDGSFGVYYLAEKQVKFQQVKVVGIVGGRAVVQGLREGTEVVVNPYWGRVLGGKVDLKRQDSR